MTKEERIKLYTALSAPFAEEAIERTEGRLTGRGYDTSGIKYQFIVDRMCEVLGVGGFRTERTITVKAITTAKGRPAYEAIAEVRLELGEWTDGEFIVFAQSWGDGGHTAMAEADARKGSYSNAFKKAAAFMGPGREAYRGTIDDDHVPADDVGSLPPSHPGVGSSPSQASREPCPAAVEPARSEPTPPAIPVSPVHPIRNRLSSKQFGALRSLSRATGYDDRGFKEEVRKRYGVEPAHLSMRQASELIGELMAQANGQGAREAG